MKRRKFIQKSGAATLGASMLACNSVANNSQDSVPTQSPLQSNPNQKIKPPRLKVGDTIGVITPGSGLKKGQFDLILQNLKSIGLKPKFTGNLKKHNGFLAGTDQERLADIHQMFEDPEVKGIICGRGGYGSARIVDQIDLEMVKSNPKAFIGFSDITVLLNTFYQKTGLICFHGPVASADFTTYTSGNLKALLMEPKDQVLIGKTDEYYKINSGEATGELAGGNLSIICSLEGTPYAVDFKDKLVFIEEIQESPYKIDRMLTQLLLSGKLSEAKGVILGNFFKCDVPRAAGVYTLKDVLLERLSKLSIPVAYGFNIGHVPDNSTLPVGIPATFNSDQGILRIEEKAVL